MTHTSEQIDLMDKVFDFYINYHFNGERRNPTNNLFAKLFLVDKSTAQFAINQVSEIGHQLQILVAQKFGYGDWEVVKMDKVKCLTFQSQGGFKKYFADKDNNIDKDLVVNQLFLNNFANTLPMTTPTSIQTQPKKNIFSSVATWTFKHVIIVIIITLFCAFLIKRFGWN